MSSDLALPCFRALRDAFGDFCAERGYAPRPGLAVTDVSRDRSTRFVGSVTAVFKPYYDALDLRAGRWWVVQDCLKTFNLARTEVLRCSYYPAFGINVPIARAQEAVLDLYCLLADAFGIPATCIEAHAASRDADLVDWVRAATASRTGARSEIDGLDPARYAHAFGDGATEGRNFVVFLDDGSGRGKRKFVATGVAISVDGVDMYLEITVKPLAIVEHVRGLVREFDVYDRPEGIERLPEAARNVFHDSLIVCCLLSRTGLIPSNRSNQARLFKKYVERLTACHGPGRQPSELASLLSEYGGRTFEGGGFPIEGLHRMRAFV